MNKTAEEYRKILTILAKHLGDWYYKTGQYHNRICEAMEEYAATIQREQPPAGEGEIQQFYKDWCKSTGRNGGVLIGGSIKELLTDFARKVSEDKESPTPETAEALKSEIKGTTEFQLAPQPAAPVKEDSSDWKEFRKWIVECRNSAHINDLKEKKAAYNDVLNKLESSDFLEQPPSEESFIYAIDWIYKHIISPLQASNESLKRDLKKALTAIDNSCDLSIKSLQRALNAEREVEKLKEENEECGAEINTQVNNARLWSDRARDAEAKVADLEKQLAEANKDLDHALKDRN